MFGRKESLWKLKRSAKAGNCESSFEVGACYLNGISADKDIDKAVEFFKLGAEQGSPGAAMALGDMLECGYINGNNEMIFNYDTAFTLFKMAAEGGLAAGFYRMGMMYKNGRGTPQNMEKAFSLILEAASKGLDQAEMTLYYMYRDGCGIEPNMDKAIKYLDMAAKKGNEEAISRLEDLSSKQNTNI